MLWLVAQVSTTNVHAWIFVIATKWIEAADDLIEYTVGRIRVTARDLPCQDCTHFSSTTFPITIRTNNMKQNV